MTLPNLCSKYIELDPSAAVLPSDDRIPGLLPAPKILTSGSVLSLTNDQRRQRDTQ